MGQPQVLAELTVGHPRRVGGPPLERQHIDEHRPAAIKRDVERAGVLQRHAGADGLGLDIERQQRRVLELAERPLVWIGDEFDFARAHDLPGGVIEGELPLAVQVEP